MEGGGKRLDGLRIVVPLAKDRYVGLHQVRVLFKLGLQEILPDLDVPVEKPVKQPGHELVLGLVGSFGIEPVGHGHILGKHGNGGFHHIVAVQGIVVQRILLVPRLLIMFVVKIVDVDDDGGSVLHPLHIGLEGRRVHGHQHIRLVPRGGDLLVPDMDLKA